MAPNANSANHGSSELLAELIERLFRQADSLLTQLAYLSTMYNARTECYTDRLLAAAFDPADIDRRLRQQHRAAFAAWLNLPLAEQHAETRRFLAHVQGAGALLRDWLYRRSYESLIPPAAARAERALFAENFEMILGLLYREGVAETAVANPVISYRQSRRASWPRRAVQAGSC